jgi:hypothetical protein
MRHNFVQKAAIGLFRLKKTSLKKRRNSVLMLKAFFCLKTGLERRFQNSEMDGGKDGIKVLRQICNLLFS